MTRPHLDFARNLGPFVVTRYDEQSLKSVVVDGPFASIEDAMDRCTRHASTQKYPYMVDRAKAFGL